MKRMDRPHLDKSTELRRCIELGYAAEQAGFIVDGMVLRRAGRIWESQPDFCVEAQSYASPTEKKPAAGRQHTQAPRAGTPTIESAGPDAPQAAPISLVEGVDNAPSKPGSVRECSAACPDSSQCNQCKAARVPLFLFAPQRMSTTRPHHWLKT